MRYVIAVSARNCETRRYGTVYLGRGFQDRGDLFIMEFEAPDEETAAQDVYQRLLKSSEFVAAIDRELIPQPNLPLEEIDRVGSLLELIWCSVSQQVGVGPKRTPLSHSVFMAADFRKVACCFGDDSDTAPVRDRLLRRANELAGRAVLLAKVCNKAETYFDDQYGSLDKGASMIYAAYMAGCEDGLVL